MNYCRKISTLVLGGIAAVAVGVVVPTVGRAQETRPGAGVAGLLNKANTINYEEIEMAKMAKDKAGDNQALLTYAKTMQDDHQANEDALTALSRQKNVKIEGTPASVDEKQKSMNNLSGGQFNEAFLNEAISGHSQALRYFEGERGKFRSDPDVQLYVEETIPVVRAHLEMARAMKQHLGENTRENPENNKHASR
jgi:putative membrane protein